MIRWSFTGFLAIAAILATPGLALGQTKVGCAGEQTTHSLHRENDPEYPFLMAQQLDADFVATDKMAPHGGGFLEGGGTSFTIGNFGHPQASVLNHDLENPKTYLKSEEFTLLSAFAPNIVVLGPFGDHDVLAGVPLTQFPADFDALIAGLQAIASKPLVALATPLPEGGVDKADGFTEINGYTQAAATKHQLPVIDLWVEFLGKTTLYQDDFHLTVEGRTHLATFVGDAVKTLAQDLGEPEPPAGGSGGAAGSAAAGGPAGGAGGSGGAAGGASPGPVAGTGSLPIAGSAGESPAPSAGTSNSGVPSGTAPSESAGCGCRSAGSSGGIGASGLLVGALLLWRRRRADAS